MGIIVFVSIVISIYGSLHFYLYRKIISQTHFSGWVNMAISIFLVFMVIFPFISRMVEYRRGVGVSYALTLVSYLWMGLFFYLLLMNLGVDLINVFAGFIRWASSGEYRSFLIPRSYPTFFSILLISMGICVFAYFEALNIGVSRITIETSKLPEHIEDLVIAQVSDLHLGVLVGEKRLKKVTSIIRGINPDIIVSTGDLVDENLDTMEGLEEELRRINPGMGKYAVTGNHEFYAGIERSVKFTQDSGFILLRNQYTNLNGIINLIGLDDPTAKRFGSNVGENISVLYSKCDPSLYTILLCHQPTGFKKNASSMPIDLQLSGHTHKGQLFPFNILTHIFFPLQGGFFEVEGRRLYASRGTGTWGPPLRFLSPPEIAVIRLKKVRAQGNRLQGSVVRVRERPL